LFFLEFYKRVPLGGIKGSSPKTDKLVGAQMEAAIQQFDGPMEELNKMKMTKEQKSKSLTSK